MRKIVDVAVVLALVSAGAATGQRLVVSGLDPSCHEGAGQAQEYTFNAVSWAAGGDSNPEIAWVDTDSCEAPEVLTPAGFTNLTEIELEDLDSADLSGFDVVFMGRLDGSEEGSEAGEAASNLASFFSEGGGIVTQDAREGADYLWLPRCDDLAFIDESGDEVYIVLESHPTMEGLTDGGLSTWGSSYHASFSDPGECTVVAADPDGEEYAVVMVWDGLRASSVPAADWMWLLALAVVLALIGLSSTRSRANA